MKYTNLIEKIISIFTITQNSWFNFIFLGFLLLVVVLVWKKKLSKNVGFLLSCVGCLCLMGYVISTEYVTLSKIFDDIMNHLFLDLYFPSIYVYLFVLLFINVVTIGSLLNIRKKGIYRTVNGICFLVTNFVLVLVLELLSKNKVDVFSKKSLFANTDLVILLEFSVSIFLIWLLSLLVIYLTDKVTERIVLGSASKISVKNVLFRHKAEGNMEVLLEENTELESTSDGDGVLERHQLASYIEDESQITPKFMPNFMEQDTKVLNKQMIIEQAFLEQNQNKELVSEQNNISMINPTSSDLELTNVVSDTRELYSVIEDVKLEENNMFDLSSFIPKKQENRIMTPSSSSTVFEQILNNTLPIIESSNQMIEEEKNTYTLNDYRIFNKMLKDIREHNQSNTISIDKNLEYRLITKYSSETYDLFKRMLKNYSN